MTYDFKRGAKVSGSKFYFNIGDTAELEFLRIQNMLQYHIKAGYTFVMPPLMVIEKVGKQAGILPRFKDDYYTTKEGKILIPTAETPLVGMHSDEIFDEKQLPIKYVALSPCFRKEAGSHGKRDHGLRRVHQFWKVELFIISTQADSEILHEEMVDHVCGMITEMWPQLKFRVLELEEKDRSPVSAKTYDIELQYKDEWLEVSSISNTLDEQSKVAQIRYRMAGVKKPIRCHLLNGSGVALPRLTLALDGEEEKKTSKPL